MKNNPARCAFSCSCRIGSPTLIAAKMGAIAAAWLISSVPVISVLAIWLLMGGHLHAPETFNLVLGQLLYGLLVGAIALFSSSVSDSAATAAIVALAFTIGSWALDFGLAGQTGLLEWVSRLSLTQVLRGFEQGLLSLGVAFGVVAAIAAFAALAAAWLHPGVPIHNKLIRSTFVVAILCGALALAAQIRVSFDVTEDRRNSFPAADQRALADLRFRWRLPSIWRRKILVTSTSAGTFCPNWNGCFRAWPFGSPRQGKL